MMGIDFGGLYSVADQSRNLAARFGLALYRPLCYTLMREVSVGDAIARSWGGSEFSPAITFHPPMTSIELLR